jgi:TrmH family RNA methyltransferase
MVTKKQMKIVKNLLQKKYRIEYGLFAVEGIKIVNELLSEGFDPYLILSDSAEIADFIDSQVQVIPFEELKKASNLHKSNGVIGVFKIPEIEPLIDSDWVLALDAVRDPGNLGTIIRLCDWFGIRQLVCSEDTVDCYNPKVLQATMGSIARVKIQYTDLRVFLEKCSQPVFGTYMQGENIYQIDIPEKGILVLGNEASGISQEITAIIEKRMTIPQFGEQTTESLNVATAASIALSEIRRIALIQK